MNRKQRLVAATAAVVVVAGATGAGIAAASSGGGDDDEGPITGEELDRASTAALEHTGGGRATETEAGDEESWYEVEVTLDDGSQVDVQLDRDLTVVGSSADREDDDGPDGAD